MDPYDNSKYESAKDKRIWEDKIDDSGIFDIDTNELPDKSGGGAGWIIFWLFFVLIILAGIGYYAKHRA